MKWILEGFKEKVLERKNNNDVTRGNLKYKFKKDKYFLNEG